MYTIDNVVHFRIEQRLTYWFAVIDLAEDNVTPDLRGINIRIELPFHFSPDESLGAARARLIAAALSAIDSAALKAAANAPPR